MTDRHQRVADALLQAERNTRDVEPFTDEWTDMSAEDGLRVQGLIIEAKQRTGETVIGVKLGLTSYAKQQRMGVSSPLTAVITDAMDVPPGVALKRDELIHPRVEPEIVFLMQRELYGPGVTAATALAAVESVHAGLEVIDSRYKNFRFKLADVLADNASSSRFTVRPEGASPNTLDLGVESATLTVDSRVVDTATGSAVQGHPAAALAFAANQLGRKGLSIPAGSIVLTGGLTDAVPIEPGQTVGVQFATLGSVQLSMDPA